MKWLVTMLLLMISSTYVHAQPLSHTGAPCQTIQTLKKEHPSQHIYYETIDSKGLSKNTQNRRSQKCYHVHASHQTGSSVNSQTIPWAASTPQRTSKTKDVLEFFSIPTMRAFSDDYTRGRNF